MASSRDRAAPPSAVSGTEDALPADGSAGTDNKAQEALDLMVEALKLIDLSAGAGVAGAHLDLAIHRLREWMDGAGR